jgi:hypothetical protein
MSKVQLAIRLSIAGFLISPLFAPYAFGQRDSVNAARLTLGVDSLEIFLLSGGAERRVGRLWDELQRIDVNGTTLVRRVYRTENAVFGPTLDTTYSTWPELRPHAHKAEGRTYTADVIYRADSVVGRRSVTLGTIVPIGRRLSGETTDAASFDLRIRASVLSADFELVSSAYLAAQDSVAQLRARVTGEQRWRAGVTGPIVDVWVVQMDFVGLASTLWIDKATRALVRQTLRLAPEVTIMWTRPGLVQR